MTRREYERGTPIEQHYLLTPAEFITVAQAHGWRTRVVAILLTPPAIRQPFQMGRFLVELIPEEMG